MKTITICLPFALITLLLIAGCSPVKDGGQQTSQWTSSNFGVTIDLPENWTRKQSDSSADTADELFAVFENIPNSQAYILNITRDEQFRNLTSDQLLAAREAEYESNPEIRFREMSGEQIWGKEFRRLLYEVTEPDGLYIVAFYVHRDADRAISMQYMYPQPAPDNIEPPAEFSQFNSALKLTFMDP